ncbi:MAG: MFS transporter [Chloroflexi bacterium]|nr:MFS transporter [Chloroflexota bacterium]
MSARALTVFLPVLAVDFETSVFVIGQVPSLMSLLAGVFALVAGPLADRHDLRRMLVMGLLMVVVSAIALPLDAEGVRRTGREFAQYPGMDQAVCVDPSSSTDCRRAACDARWRSGSLVHVDLSRGLPRPASRL